MIDNLHCANANSGHSFEQVDHLFFMVVKFVGVETLADGGVLRRFFFVLEIYSIALRFSSLYSQASAGVPVKVVRESIIIVPLSLFRAADSNTG